MPRDVNDIPSPLEDRGGNGKMWLYGGAGVAIIVVGAAIFFFATRTKPQQAMVSLAASSTSAAHATIPLAAVSPAITINVQQSKSGPHLVVQWENLPKGTSKINIYRAPTESSASVLIGSVEVPPSSSGGGNGSLDIPNMGQGGYYYGTASGGGTQSYNSPSAPGTGNSSASSNSSSLGSGSGNGGASEASGNNQGSSNSTNGSSSTGSGSSSNNDSDTGNTSTPAAPGSDQVSSSSTNGSSSTSTASSSSSDSGSNNDNGNSGAPAGPGSDQGSSSSTNGSSSSQNGNSSSPTSSDASTTMYSPQGSCSSGYVLIGSWCVLESTLPTQASLTWNGSYYSVENGLYTDQDIVYVSDVAGGSLSNITVYCSYTNYSIMPVDLGGGNYEISGLSSHGCNVPDSIDYLNLGGYYGDNLDISVTAPTLTY